MNNTAAQFLAQRDETPLPDDIAPEALAQCTALLDDEDRYALRRYWNRLVWEECAPLAERIERVPSFAELDERRAQRRMRRLSAAVTEATPVAQDSNSGIAPDAA